MDTAHDGSLNRHGGQADMESNADERNRERAEAVEERAEDILGQSGWVCPECDWDGTEADYRVACSHVDECELLRARAEHEVDTNA